MAIAICGYLLLPLIMWGIFARIETVAIIMACLTMLVGASAISIGSTSLNPAVIFLALFFVRSLFVKNRGEKTCQNKGVYYFAFFLLFAILITIFSPFFFENSITVVWHSHDISQPKVRQLHYDTGNITQSFYAIGSFLCFFASYRIFKATKDPDLLIKLGFWVAFFHLFWSFADAVTFYTGTSDLLGFIRNANESINDQVSFLSLRRIAGSYWEASFYATATLSLFAFFLTICTSGFKYKFSYLFCFLLFVFLMLSLSTTAYVGLFLYFIWLFIRSTYHFILSPKLGKMIRIISAVIFVFVLCCVILSVTEIGETIVDHMITNKLSSVSGIERSFWNLTAWNSMLESFGLGIGLGSTRASSFVLVLLSNTGIIGTILYALFLIKALASYKETDKTSKHQIAIVACREAVIANLIGASLSSTVFDLGLQIYIFAGAAAGLSTIRFKKDTPSYNHNNAR